MDLPLSPLLLVARIDDNVLSDMLHGVVWLTNDDSVAVSTASLNENACPILQLLGSFHHNTVNDDQLPVKALVICSHKAWLIEYLRLSCCDDLDFCSIVKITPNSKLISLSQALFQIWRASQPS